MYNYSSQHILRTKYPNGYSYESLSRSVTKKYDETIKTVSGHCSFFSDFDLKSIQSGVYNS